MYLLYQHINLAYYADRGSIPLHPTKPPQVLLRRLFIFLSFVTFVDFIKTKDYTNLGGGSNDKIRTAVKRIGGGLLF